MSHIPGSVASHQSSSKRVPVETRSATLVWIDSKQATVVHWSDGSAKVEHLASDVPVHRRSTGVGSCAPQPDAEGRRLEHLARFRESVASHIPADDDLVIVGPGTVHEQLARDLELTDKHARRTRLVACRTAAPMTERQLIAELRSEIGVPAPRKKQTRRPERKAPKPTDDSLVELDTLGDDPDDRSR